MMHTYSFSRRWVHYYRWQWDIQHWTLLLLISSSRFLLTCWRSVKRISRKTLPFSYYGLRSECFAWTALRFMRVPVLSRVLKPRFKLWVWSGCQWNLRSSDDVCNAFTWVMDENLRNFFVSGISAPSGDVMLVKYTSVNELMVVKVNVKIVSTMINEVRSILADTLEPESFQINQNHNKDLGQHQLNWPGECFLLFVWMFPYFLFRKNCVPYGSIYFCGNMGTICGNILHEILFLNFFPNINFEEKFYSDKKGKFLSKALKNNIETFFGKMNDCNSFILFFEIVST